MFKLISITSHPLLFSIFFFLSASVYAAPSDYFTIEIVDSATQRGVPLVELETVNQIRFISDSNGLIAFSEPGLMNREIYFTIRSHGYEYPKDGFGFRGIQLTPNLGAKKIITLKRINIAERLYRITGQGIYRDSILLDRKVPIREPLLNASVFGQDTVQATIYQKKIFWIFGDTNRPDYPLGNFGSSGAVSEIPTISKPIPDASLGIDLQYFQDPKGFSRAMVSPESIPEPGPKWLTGMVTILDRNNQETILATMERVRDVGETQERCLLRFDDVKKSFVRLQNFSLNDPLYLVGHPVLVEKDKQKYLYMGEHLPYLIRVPNDWKNVRNLKNYEGFSPLVPGTRYLKEKTQLDRKGQKINYGWKKDTPPLTRSQQNQLIQLGLLKREEIWQPFRDQQSLKVVNAHAGSLTWNEYRKCWLAIFTEIGGSSELGEIWYAEANTPIGPWSLAQKIITHDKYSFYNPAHHPFYDQARGSKIFIQGTYTTLFSGNPIKTPRYDYNQLMYGLNLNDERLTLAKPVFEIQKNGITELQTELDSIRESVASSEISVPFMALSVDSKRKDSVPIYKTRNDQGDWFLTPHEGTGKSEKSILFFRAMKDNKKEKTTPLFEYTQLKTGKRMYRTTRELKLLGWQRREKPICFVWENLQQNVFYD